MSGYCFAQNLDTKNRWDLSLQQASFEVDCTYCNISFNAIGPEVRVAYRYLPSGRFFFTTGYYYAFNRTGNIARDNVRNQNMFGFLIGYSQDIYKVNQWEFAVEAAYRSFIYLQESGPALFVDSSWDYSIDFYFGFQTLYRFTEEWGFVANIGFSPHLTSHFRSVDLRFGVNYKF